MHWFANNGRSATLDVWRVTRTSQASGGSSTPRAHDAEEKNASAKTAARRSLLRAIWTRSSAVEVAGCATSVRSASPTAGRSTGTGRAVGIFGSVTATSRCGGPTRAENANSFLSIASSWRSILAASSTRLRRFITRMATRLTIAWRISSCAWAVMDAALPRRIAVPVPASAGSARAAEAAFSLPAFRRGAS